MTMMKMKTRRRLRTSRLLRRPSPGGGVVGVGGRAEEPPAPAPAPTRRRPRRDPGAPIPVVGRRAKYVRSRRARPGWSVTTSGERASRRRELSWRLRRGAIARDWSKLLEWRWQTQSTITSSSARIVCQSGQGRRGSDDQALPTARDGSRVEDPQAHKSPDDLAHAKGIKTVNGSKSSS